MTDMKRKFIICLITVATVWALSSVKAQAPEVQAPEGYEYVDSLVYVYAVDSVYVIGDVFLDMPSRSEGDAATVEIRQSEILETSMRQHIRKNASRTIPGYRVRIFFDNKQSARSESESAIGLFRTICPGVASYRSYSNPYFKVTVGNFRTKSEAQKLLARIKGNFPGAFIVKENIRFPYVGAEESEYRVDTVKVLRPVVSD